MISSNAKTKLKLGSGQLTLSIVSHLQAEMVKVLLDDLASLAIQNFNVVLTINDVSEKFEDTNYPFHLHIIRNMRLKGFGENHNQAFASSSSEWFAVLNPDLRISSFDFESFLRPFDDKSVMALAPLIISDTGLIEDSARKFPTVFSLLRRFFLSNQVLDYRVQEKPYPVDWVGGMFMVFHRETFLELSGFDQERFFMYMEDVDICRRIKKNGGKVLVNPNHRVVHNAQRASRNKLSHFKWHIVSVFRYMAGI